MKLLKASVIAGVVHVGENPAPDIEILSSGLSDSEGRVLIGDSFAVYIVDTQPDLSKVIVELSKVCEQLITVGGYAYVTAADNAVTTTPLIGVANSATNIKAYLDGFKPI